MPAPKHIKSIRVQISLSDEACRKYEQIAHHNGFTYGTGMMAQVLENLSQIDPDRFLEAIVAAKQAGRKPEVVPPRPVGRPPLPKAG